MVQPCHHNQMHAHRHTHTHTVALSIHLDIITRYTLQRETIAAITVAGRKTHNRCVLLKYSEMGGCFPLIHSSLAYLVS